MPDIGQHTPPRRSQRSPAASRSQERRIRLRSQHAERVGAPAGDHGVAMLVYGAVAGETREQTVGKMVGSMQDAAPPLPQHEIAYRLEVLRQAAALVGLTPAEIEVLVAPPALH
jgi:hypothetical protein